MIDDTKILQHLATQEVSIKQVLDVWLLRLLRSSQPCCSLCQIWLALVTWPCTACVGPSTVHQHGAPDMTARVWGFFALTDDGRFFQQLISSWERFLLLRLHSATIRVVCQKLQGCPNHQPVSLPERTVLVDCLLGMTAMFKYCGSCLQPAPRTYTVTLHPSDYV